MPNKGPAKDAASRMHLLNGHQMDSKEKEIAQTAPERNDLTDRQPFKVYMKTDI